MYGSAESDFTSWIYNDIINKVMTISDNRIARSVPSGLVKRSYFCNYLFHWMVCMVLGPVQWNFLRFPLPRHFSNGRQSERSKLVSGIYQIIYTNIYDLLFRKLPQCIKLYSQMICYADKYILFNFPMAPLRDFPMAPLRDVAIQFSRTFPIKFPEKKTLLQHTI